MSWKRVPKPKIGAHVYGITKDKGAGVEGDYLGIIVNVNPTYIFKEILLKELWP